VAAHVFSDFFVGNFFSHKPFLFAFLLSPGLVSVLLAVGAVACVH
jgi:hypothetical protein